MSTFHEMHELVKLEWPKSQIAFRYPKSRLPQLLESHNRLIQDVTLLMRQIGIGEACPAPQDRRSAAFARDPDKRVPGRNRRNGRGPSRPRWLA